MRKVLFIVLLVGMLITSGVRIVSAQTSLISIVGNITMQNGQPVPNVVVVATITGHSSSIVSSTRTITDGSYQLDSLEQGVAYDISYIAPPEDNLAPVNITSVIGQQGMIIDQVLLDAPTTYYTFSGIVRDATGTPKQGITVRVRGAYYYGADTDVISDTSGHYSVILPPGVYNVGLLGTISGVKFEMSPWQDGRLLTDSDLTQNFQLPPFTSTLTVNIRDSQGIPVANQRVDVTNATSLTPTPAPGNDFSEYRVSLITQAGSTNTNGEVSFPFFEGMMVMQKALRTRYAVSGDTISNVDEIILNSTSVYTLFDDVEAPTFLGSSFSPSSLAVGSNTHLALDVTDNLSGVSDVTYIDPYSGGSQPMSLVGQYWVADFGGLLPVGVYNVQFRARDYGGNWSEYSSLQLVVFSPAAGKLAGTAKFEPSQTDVLPIAISTQGNRRLTFKFSKVGYVAGAGLEGVFDASYIVKNNINSFTITSSSLDWLVIQPLGLQAQLQGLATLTVLQDGVTSVTQNTFRVSVTLGQGGAPDHLTLYIYAPGVDPNSATPIYSLEDDAQISNVLIG